MLKIINVTKRQLFLGSYQIDPGKYIFLQDYELNDTIKNKLDSLLSLDFVKTFEYPNEESPIEYNSFNTIYEEAEIITEKPRTKTSKKK